LKKLVWLILSCLVVMALVLSSCTTTPAEENEGETITGEVTNPTDPDSETEQEGEETTTTPTGPQYGGSLTLASIETVRSWDPATVVSGNNWQTEEQYYTLVARDWSRGPTGSGEYPYSSQYTPEEAFTGRIAESWDIPDTMTVIFHLREGINFQNIAPVNGREVTADDVVFTLNYFQNNPRSNYYRPEAEDQATMEALDKYTVKLTYPRPDIMRQLSFYGGGLFIVPHELVDTYGNIEDWRNQCGTGAFILTDYVSDSSLTFEPAEPKQWTDPNNPENLTPYVDRYKIMLLADKATALAALRTGKIDKYLVNWEDAEMLRESNPELNERQVLGNYCRTVEIANDNEIFSDINLRKAFALATDRDSFIDDFYKGNADLHVWPIRPDAPAAFTPMDELPADAQELFEYNPEKAKEYLAAAGYPDGFHTTLLVPNYPDMVDIGSILEAQWAASDIDLEIEVIESGTFYSMMYGHKNTELSLTHWSNAAPYTFAVSAYPCGGLYNYSHVCDEYFDTEWDRISTIEDSTERNAALKDLGVYALQQAWNISLPLPTETVFWQPWLKGYNGEQGRNTQFLPASYVWIDQDVKYEYTGQRD